MNDNNVNNPGADVAMLFKKIMILVAAVMYFVFPIDVIPDFIPLLGIADDIAVAVFAGKQMTKK